MVGLAAIVGDCGGISTVGVEVAGTLVGATRGIAIGVDVGTGIGVTVGYATVAIGKLVDVPVVGVAWGEANVAIGLVG